MQLLRWIFLGLFAFGLWTGMYGGAILALLMWGIICYASGVFAEQDRLHARSIAGARPCQGPTSDALLDHECECMADKL